MGGRAAACGEGCKDGLCDVRPGRAAGGRHVEGAVALLAASFDETARATVRTPSAMSEAAVGLPTWSDTTRTVSCLRASSSMVRTKLRLNGL